MTGVLELKEARLIPRLIKIWSSNVVREQKEQQPGSWKLELYRDSPVYASTRLEEIGRG